MYHDCYMCTHAVCTLAHVSHTTEVQLRHLPLVYLSELCTCIITTCLSPV